MQLKNASRYRQETPTERKNSRVSAQVPRGRRSGWLLPFTRITDDMYWRATGGCVAVSEESMIKILQMITPGASVTIR